MDHTVNDTVQQWTPLVGYLLWHTFRMRPEHPHYEDAKQDGLIGAWKAIRKHGIDANSTIVGLYIRSNITDGIRSRLGRHGQKNPQTIGLDAATDDGNTGDHIADLSHDDGGYLLVDFKDAYRQLTPRQQQVCTHILYGYNLQESADLLGVTKSRVWQLRQKLRAELQAFVQYA